LKFLILTRRDKKILIDNRFLYHYNSISARQNRIYWQCVNHKICNLKIYARDTPNEMPINIVRGVINNIINEELLVILSDRNCLRTVNNVQNRESTCTR